MSLRSEAKKQLHEDKAEKREEMKETFESIRRPLPRFQKDSTNSVSARAHATPRAWPLLPFFAAVLCMGILGMRLLPPSKYTNWADPFKSWDPHDKVGSLISNPSLPLLRLSLPMLSSNTESSTHLRFK